MSRQLLSFDTDRIKEYLFATPALSDIRVASAILDDLNRVQTLVVLRSVYPDLDENTDLIYAAGGSAMVVLPNETTASQAIRAVERLYRRETVIATITGEKVPISDKELRSNFGSKVRQVGHRLRQRKASRGRGRTLPVAPYMHFCDVCSQHPAVHPDGEELICRACEIKRRPEAREARRGLWQKLIQVTDARPADPPAEWEDLFQGTLGKRWHSQHRPPADFGDIGDAARRKGYIALIYADGNNVGRVLEKLPTQKDYRSFSENIDDLLLRVTYKTLMDQVQKQPGKSLFEVLMVGGDDLMLVTTADIALDVALALMRDFEAYSAPLMSPHGEEPLSLGTGIVIAQSSLPIAAMQDLATALQERAKRRGFEAGGVGAIDFMVVTAAGSQGLDRLREEILTEHGFAFPPADERSYRLTQRPYILGDLADLIERGRALKRSGFPTTQLQAMYEALFRSPTAASLTAIQVIGRARRSADINKDHRRLLLDFFYRFGAMPGPPPWRDQGAEGLDSALGDLIEIYPFI